MNVEYGNTQIKSILALYDIPDQPVSDLNSNCTGVFTLFGCQARGWAAINCKQTLFTAFICLARSKTTVKQVVPQWRNGPSRNLTCPKGWLFIDFKCFKFIKHNYANEASWPNAHYTCQREGGRLLSVRQIPQPKKVELHISEFARMLQSYSSDFNAYRYYTAEEWTIILAGVPFKYDSNPFEISHIFRLLRMLSSMTTRKPLILPFFEISTETCWTLELGHLQYMSQQRSDDMHFNDQIFWGLKAIRCILSLEVDVTAFVCERLPIKYNTSCVVGHFSCEDKTCILSVYVCDDVIDCLNGEDEYRCPERNYTTQLLSHINKHSDSQIICLMNKNTTLIYAHVHSLCDGMHTCTIVNEDLCSYRETKPIYKSLRYLLNTDQDVNLKDDSFIIKEAAYVVWNDPLGETLKLAKRDPASSSLSRNRRKDSFRVLRESKNWRILDAFQLPCKEMTTSYTVYDYCIVYNKYPCVYGKYSQMCRPVVCVGMFKCREYGCIRLSSMCDGHGDCPSAEDEYNCANITCPGLLKCRNENRCIGLEQMCDGISDCIYSSDDEMTCNKCSVGCRCEGYIMQCKNLETENIELLGINHAKSIILKGNINKLSLDKIQNKDLVSLDVSFCNIQSVVSARSKIHVSVQNVLHANFSNNNIKIDSFLSDTMFLKLCILDLGNNLLTILVNRSLTHLNHIKILRLNRNPIMYVTFSIFNNFPNLFILDIENIYLLKCKFSIDKINLNSTLHIMTDDALFCCYFTNTVHCFTSVVRKCNGFIHNVSHRIIFCGLTLIACSVLILSTGKYLYSLVCQGFKNALFSVLLNIGLSEILSCAYICCIVAVAWQNVNIIYWQTGKMCVILQRMLTLALVSTVTFRCLAALVLLLKIVYPFKHQCRWLHYILIICGTIWLISIIYTILITHQFVYSHSVFCTHWCQGADQLLPLKISIAAVELICVFAQILFIIMTEKALRKSMVTAASCQRTKAVRSPFRIISPLAVELCAEAIFRFLSVSLNFSEFATMIDIDSFCIVVIFLILPIKIIIAISPRHIKQMVNK